MDILEFISSSSKASAPSSHASSKAGIVFSGASADAPLWAKILGYILSLPFIHCKKSVSDTKFLRHSPEENFYSPMKVLTVCSRIIFYRCVDALGHFELDVHLSADGSLVVIHDDTVDRTSNGTGSVNSMTYEELSRLNFSNGMAGYSDVKLPLLSDVQALARRNSIYVNVEIKEYALENSSEIIQKLLELEKKYGMAGNIIYSSLDHYLLRDIKKISRETATAVLFSDGLVDAWEYAEKLSAQAVHPFYLSLNDDLFVSECHRRHLEVNPWTLNSRDDLAAAFRAGADGVITNRVDLARSVRDRCLADRTEAR
jgi:glycerophosphoryl diester phosphodiesterase